MNFDHVDPLESLTGISMSGIFSSDNNDNYLPMCTDKSNQTDPQRNFSWSVHSAKTVIAKAGTMVIEAYHCYLTVSLTSLSAFLLVLLTVLYQDGPSFNLDF